MTENLASARKSIEAFLGQTPIANKKTARRRLCWGVEGLLAASARL
jgi:hypothetical protein